MDVKSLYTMVAIADYGSFAEAGKAIGLSISGVSLQVRALEEETGVSLFDRSTRPPTLTERGHDFVQKAREVIVHWEKLSKSLKRDAARGVLRVGAIHTTVSGLVPRALRQLQIKRPELHIQLVTALSHELEDLLRRGSLDCAVVTEPEALSSDFSFHKVSDEPLVVIAHVSVKGTKDRELLESNPYVRFNRLARLARFIDANLSRLGISVKSQMEVDTLDGVIALVANSLGVSIVPVRKSYHPFPPEIRSVPFGKPNIVRRLGVVQLSNSHRAHLVDLFVEELSKMINID